jgi:hypothetical protein
LRDNEIALIKRNPSFFRRGDNKSIRTFSRRDRSAMLNNFNAEVDRISQFNNKKGKTKSMTPNLIPRNMINRMKNSGQFSANMSLQTDHGHYLHNRNYFGRSNMPDHQSWISNSNINKRFGKGKYQGERKARISESNYEDPSLYRYGQQSISNSNYGRYPNQFSTKFSGQNSLTSSTKGLTPKDASNVNNKRFTNPSGARFSMEPGKYRQSNLRKIDENDSNENYYYIETSDGKRKVWKKSQGKNDNQYYKEDSSQANVNNNDYVIDKSTGKKYYKRKSKSSNQNIYYIDENGKKIIIQNTKNMGNSQGNAQANINQNHQKVYIDPKTGEKIVMGDPNANGFYIDPITKKRIWIVITKISDENGHFVDPVSKLKLKIQYSKLSKQAAFFQHPKTNKGMSIQLISAHDQVQNNPQTRNRTLSTKSASNNQNNRKVSGNTSTTYITYTIDPKTGERIIRRSVRQNGGLVTNNGQSNTKKILINRNHGKSSDISKNQTMYERVDHGTMNNNPHGRYSIPRNQVRMNSTTKKNLGISEYNNTRKDITNSSFNNHLNDQSSERNPYRMTFEDFESFNKSNLKQQNGNVSDIMKSNYSNNIPNSRIIQGKDMTGKYSNNNSITNTRVNNRLVSPHTQRVTYPINSNTSTKYNNFTVSQSKNKIYKDYSPENFPTIRKNQVPVDMISNTSLTIETTSKLSRKVPIQNMDNYKLKRYGSRVNN